MMCLPNKIRKMVTNLWFKNLLQNFSAVKKKLPKKTVISYATKSPNNHMAINGPMDAEIIESLICMVVQAMAATIWQPQKNSLTSALLFQIRRL